MKHFLNAMRLTQWNSIRSSEYFHHIGRSKILQIKILGEIILYHLDCTKRSTKYVNVIHIETKNDVIIIIKFIWIDALVILMDTESKMCNDFVELMMPLFWCLFKSIQWLHEFAHFIFLSLGNESSWLVHVNFLLKISIKKGSFHIHFMNEHVMN